jgi:hypothetical protein
MRLRKQILKLSATPNVDDFPQPSENDLVEIQDSVTKLESISSAIGELNEVVQRIQGEYSGLKDQVKQLLNAQKNVDNLSNTLNESYVIVDATNEWKSFFEQVLQKYQ